MAADISLSDIKKQLSDPARIPAYAFDTLRSLCTHLSRPDTEQRAQDLVLRALEHREAFGSAVAMLDGLVRQLGLFPYLEQDDLG
jgi:hypothetical protein